MDLMGVVSRANAISNDFAVRWTQYLVERYLLGKSDPTPLEECSVMRLFFVTQLYIYGGSLLMYFLVAGLDYLIVFVLFRRKFLPEYVPNYSSMRREISLSVRSLLVMSALVVPVEMLASKGYARIYDDVGQHGLLYFFVSPVLFLLFSDFMIYWIHRGLHHRSIYRHLHKLHHSFVHTTPFAAFAFHPLDGYAQGVAYQIFIFLLPFHSLLHLVSLMLVGIWTINIHDRVTLGIPLINGAGHHQIHHTTFRSNYGQYFTLSDRLFGTFKDPVKWRSVVKTEEEVYGPLDAKTD